MKGAIAISIGFGDSNILMVSNDLLLNLEYETSKISFHVSYATFHTGVDSFDTRLKALGDTGLDFTGKISISINTKKYDPQNYIMEGTMSCAGHAAIVRGKGTMTCLPSANRLTPACTLLFSVESTLSSLDLSQVFTSAKEGLRIDLRQSILEKDTP